MAVVPMQNILTSAFKARYGVGAFNIVNDLTMLAVLEAASDTKSPVIIQVSVKTVKLWGAELIQKIFADLAARYDIPATLHLDHCPEVETIKTCLQAGWNSVLFDASNLDYEENMRQTKEVVKMARGYGAAVEGELEAVKGVEDGMGSEEGSDIVPLDKCVEFLDQTGIDSFAPAIGTAHGLYATAPKIDFARVEDIVTARPTPIVLHGGTGLSTETFQRLISLGCAKVNISTMLKITYCDAQQNYLNEKPKQHDPLKLMKYAQDQVRTMAANFMNEFGSAGKAVR